MTGEGGVPQFTPRISSHPTIRNSVAPQNTQTPHQLYDPPNPNRRNSPLQTRRPTKIVPTQNPTVTSTKQLTHRR
ncbi:hypothetical protein BO83DRAFT_227052 [Aspergillus eucalypticola CBS 122712]|uniref:Uncharacterized protein n=1 Tax=Aspergillus eucalypticola (strain CBS 122712 / IBT 29274) TaxID=1448314 RepID=A0A317W0Z4_ASPEC|nr:uncharacterized protein BO83DRAFT_227052 [Aspergillus eucalypticola CBS 122712]PWY77820.1 hypothetical protein BO83DRAFT_227052 [Aspergillus eucalypticola CBS 122712]